MVRTLYPNAAEGMPDLISTEDLIRWFRQDNFDYSSEASLRSDRIWLIAKFGEVLLANRKFQPALEVERELYMKLVAVQAENGLIWIHKGVPLYYLSLCYYQLNFPVHAKRYAMLSLAEDAVHFTSDCMETGTARMLRWFYGLSEAKLREYIGTAVQGHSVGTLSVFPEFALDDFGQEWRTEYPTAQESLIYTSNHIYIEQILRSMPDKTGKKLERLAQYVLGCMPGCRTQRRRITFSTDLDLVCSIDGADLDFRSEFGRYFVCECKNWIDSADFTVVAKLCRVLDSVKSKFGILFSTNGITGQQNTTAGYREILKVYQDRGIVIVVIDSNDLHKLASGESFIEILRSKYETVRLDLRPPYQVTRRHRK